MAFLTGAMIALTGASALSSASGARRAGRAARAAGAAEERLLDFNAQVSERQATDAIARGAEAKARLRGDLRRQAGSTRAALAASGVDLDAGSALDVQADSEAAGALDLLTVEMNARREAYGYRVQAMDARLRRQAVRAGAQGQAAAYGSQAVSTLLTGAAQIGGIYAGRPRAPRKP
jgi:hypothetical protein